MVVSESNDQYRYRHDSLPPSACGVIVNDGAMGFVA